MALLYVRLLGPFEVEIEGRQVTKTFRTEKERALFAYLISGSNRPNSREVLAELFWPNRAPGSARTNLRQALAGIRKALGDRNPGRSFLVASDESIVFERDSDYWLDVETFQGHFQFTLTHPHQNLESCPICLERIQAAISLYRGSFLEGFFQAESQDLNEWLSTSRERYLHYMLSALAKVSRYYELKGELEIAIQYTQEQVALDSLDEGARRQLMLLYFKNGRRSLALEQYQLCCHVLHNELGVAPSEETVAIFERIKHGSTPLPRRDSQLLKRLPSDLTSFTGREVDLERFARCIPNPDCRLLTLVGQPGVGKSRLALKVASLYKHLFADGVWFFSLEQVLSPQDLASALLEGLGVMPEDEKSLEGQLIHFLSSKKAFLVLDHFEHLLSKTDLLIEILHHAPGIKILITSCERLNYQAACLFELRGLPFPKDHRLQGIEQYPAVKLFTERAQNCRGSFQLSEQILPDVLSICQEVEGNPLALELAATLLRQYSINQISQKVKSSISNLSTNLNDIPDRHRNLSNLYGAAFSHLNEVELETLQALALLEGKFSLEETYLIVDEPIEMLANLVNKSLVYKDAQGYFQMALLCRKYVREKYLGRDLVEHTSTGQKAGGRPDQVFDELTGLLLPHMYWDRLNNLIIKSDQRKEQFAVIAIDLLSGCAENSLEEFIRDTILQIAADRLHGCLRANDTLARLTREEIYVLIEAVRSEKECIIIVRKILKILENTYEIGSRRIDLPVRIGISFYPIDSQDAQMLVDAARLAGQQIEPQETGYRFSSLLGRKAAALK